MMIVFWLIMNGKQGRVAEEESASEDVIQTPRALATPISMLVAKLVL